jgi:hypothetical protein
MRNREILQKLEAENILGITAQLIEAARPGLSHL